MVFMLTVIIQMKILHKKDAYNNALKQAEDIINNSSNPNLNAQDITNALNNIKQAQDNLHGAQKLQQDKKYN